MAMSPFSFVFSCFALAPFAFVCFCLDLLVLSGAFVNVFAFCSFCLFSHVLCCFHFARSLPLSSNLLVFSLVLYAISSHRSVLHPFCMLLTNIRRKQYKKDHLAHRCETTTTARRCFSSDTLPALFHFSNSAQVKQKPGTIVHSAVTRPCFRPSMQSRFFHKAKKPFAGDDTCAQKTKNESQHQAPCPVFLSLPPLLLLSCFPSFSFFGITMYQLDQDSCICPVNE